VESLSLILVVNHGFVWNAKDYTMTNAQVSLVEVETKATIVERVIIVFVKNAKKG
jgi:hypothetical protein